MTQQADTTDFERRARENQQRLNADLKPVYDFIVCGGGSSGSVIARRLGENAYCQVLLIEAGGDDAAESVLDLALWPTNLSSDRDWGIQAQPNPHLDGRALPMSMARGLATAQASTSWSGRMAIAATGLIMRLKPATLDGAPMRFRRSIAGPRIGRGRLTRIIAAPTAPSGFSQRRIPARLPARYWMRRRSSASQSSMPTCCPIRPMERSRVLYLANNVTTQSGELSTKGVEFEASRVLPGNFELLLNYGYSQLDSEVNTGLDYMPRHTASVWSTKTFGDTGGPQLRLGAGVVYSGESKSTGALDPYGLNAAIAPGTLYTIVTPSRTTVDALAEISWNKWRLAINAANLLDNRGFASCLARGDCFMAAPRNVMATLGFRF